MIILSALVLVCIIVLLFMSRSLLNRQISFTSAGQYRAENLGVTAIDTIVGDLKSEIAAGSTKSVSDGIAIYQPTTNFTAVPQRVGDGGFANVVKRSAGGVAFWSGGNYASSISSPVRAAAGNSTINASANGRLIKAAKWNDPYLLGTNLPAGFVPPDWIVVTRSGAITNAAQMPSMADLSNPASTNRSFAIGRFAYMIYDEGGLLDVNVAGFPSTVSDDFKKRRGTLPQVDLAKIPGIANASALVEWRNAATFNAYADKVLSSTNGFLTVAQGDQTFVSRQDLIKYVQQHTNQISLEALPYLATFTRELNAPSYTPAPDRRKIGPGYVTTGYDDEFNPSLVNTRVAVPFSRQDGTAAIIGEPLLKHRFPLSRLGLLTREAVATEDSAPIPTYFGLKRSSSSDPWVYREGADRILRLSEVAAAGREPDFFELLQAGILAGSLGRGAGSNDLWPSNVKALDENLYLQVAQIAANLIDQYDGDSFPTRVSFGLETVSGVENLPYLLRVLETPYRWASTSSSSGYSRKIAAWYRPEVWNPHAQATNPPVGPEAPMEFRFITRGKAYFEGYKVYALVEYPIIPNGGLVDLPNSEGIKFSNGAIFSQPIRLDDAPDVNAEGRDRMQEGSKTFVGIFVGEIETSDGRYSSDFPNTSDYRCHIVGIIPQPMVSHELQYRNGDQWITYDAIRNVGQSARSYDDDSSWVASDRLSTIGVTSLFERSDPRSDRFGVGITSEGYHTSTGLPLLTTSRPDAGMGYYTRGIKENPSGWSFGPSRYGIALTLSLGTLADNKSNSDTHYVDPDGTLRMADGAYTTGSLSDGYPLATGNLPSRPVMLNRPFRSVGEMGYASRGMPWKHIDFFTKDSGDMALLDLFCTSEAPDEAVVAGRINLNTHQEPVLRAAIAGALKVEDTEVALSDTEASSLAASLIGLTKDANKGPLLNRSDLVTKWIGDPSVVPANSSDTIIKRRREAALRSLTDLGNTRTWNLLIDVVAQGGRYGASAANLNQFTVEGERRFWLHVAIDRYTGKVVDQHLETVSE